MTLYRGFYYPDDEEYDSPVRAGLEFEEVTFWSRDGTALSGWFIHAKKVSGQHKPRGTVIHMHGNAQNMTAHWQFAEWLPFRGFNLFTFDYRGFGKSEGVAGPQGIFDDAVAALDYVRTRPDQKESNLFVFGQSLGGMLCIGSVAASPERICAVLAEDPVHSYSKWVNDRSPGAGDALDDTYCATGWVSKLAPIPLLLIHGTHDVVVDYSHSVALYAEAKQPKKLITIEGGDHVDAMTRRWGNTYQNAMVNFFEDAASRPGPVPHD